MSYSNGKEPTSGLSVEYKAIFAELVAWIDSPSKAEEERDDGVTRPRRENDKNHHDIMKCLFGDDED